MTSGTEDKLRQYLRRVTLDLGQTRQRLREVEDRLQEPIAVVGMACRYPGGVRGPEDLWALVTEGRDAIGEFPADRGWDLDALYDPDPANPGTSYVRNGGFVYDADRFDAAFFGISPREALAMEPQQRLLLETAWELLERAGIDPLTLKGSPTGVYAGAGLPGVGAPQIERSEGHLLTGNALSVLSGRVAFTLGLEGPAISVDTACSSSLVALHLACHGLRQGECSLALAGGVTVLATPFMFTEFSRQRGLSPDGRCKPFAEAADGTGFAEGAGLVLLERLSDAQRNGRRILAVIRGSAINQDGASNGLTAPKGPSQERVIRQALAAAGLSPSEIDVVEAHGTGTRLGDPIEAGALLAAYGADRDRPLWLGSVKSNIGHTQGAAGVAGVIKMVLALRHGRLPATLHVDRPSTHVDWSSGAVRLLTEPVDWTPGAGVRRAAVSAFGMSGTNAHLILEEAPAGPRPEPGPEPGVVPWVVSGRDEAALRDQAVALRARVAADPEVSSADVGWSLATTRSAFAHRAVLIGERREELLAGLAALAADETAPGLICPGGPAESGGSAGWLFSGQGSQRPGMGAELHGRFPVFAQAFDEVCALLDPHLEHPLRQVMWDGTPGLLDHTTYTQAGLFALQVALARLLGSLGQRPDVLIGHSIGEVAAAHVAGVFDLQDACRLVAARATLMGRLPEGGAMAAIHTGADQLADGLARYGGRVAVAALNAPNSTVISGPADLVAELTREIAASGRKTTMLRVSHAFHSPLMEPVLDDFRRAIEDVAFHEPEIPIISNLTGLPADERIATPGYWAEHIRSPVRFHPAVSHVAPDTGVFLELGPDPVLSAAVEQTLDHDGSAHRPLVAATLTRKRAEVPAFTEMLGRLHTRGRDVDWAAWYGPGRRVVDLPTYAFQRRRFWPERGPGGDATGLGLTPGGHPLLAASVDLAGQDTHVLTGRLSATGWLADHRVLGTLLAPGAALVEWALRAADEAGAGAVAEVVLREPLVLPDAGGVRVQVVIDRADGEIQIYSRPDAAGDWVCNATGALGPAPDAPPSLGDWPPEGAEEVEIDGFYERTAAAGYDYGPAFRGLRAVWRDGADLLAEVVLPEAAGEGFAIHPALLDAALHPGLLIDEADDAVWLPFAWTDVALWATDARHVRVRLTPLQREGAGERTLRLTMTDPLGGPVLSVGSVVLRPVEPARLRARREHGLFTLDWAPVEAAQDAPVPWAALGPSGLTGVLEDGAAGPPVVVATVPPSADALGAVRRTLNLLRDWLAEPRLAEARLAVVTRHAVACDDPDPAGAAVWGLVRSAQIEEPDRFVLVDLDADSADSAEAVELALRADEPQVAIRDGRPLAPRLVPAADAGKPAALDPAGTVLVTGGTGMAGGAIAEHLVRACGVRRLVLVGRRGLDAPGARERLELLTELGAEVRVVAADVADPAAVAGLIREIDPERPLTGVVHAAGILDDAVLSAQSDERLDRVWAAKATAAVNLHEATAGLPLRMFVLFSSAASWLGSPGQANYAAANAFCDALAARRRGAGLPGQSIGWGLWADPGGMAGGLGETDLVRLGRSGGRPLSHEQALELFDSARTHDGPCVLAVDLDRRVLAARPAHTLPAPLRAFGSARRPRRAAAGTGPASSDLAARLAGLDADRRVVAVLEVVRGCAAEVLGHRSAEEIRADAPFKDIGFDSLAAVEFRNRLAALCGIRLPATLVFDHPTPQALAGHLTGRLTGRGAAGGTAVVRAAADEPIALVAMACRYPGEVSSPEELWELVAAGRDAIGEFPADRGWDLSRLFHPDPDHPGTSYAREGGFVSDAGGFDAAFFGVNRREAVAMDPQQRLLLETAWQVLERAGIDPGTLRGSRTGVYAGVMYHDYGAGMVRSHPQLEGYAMFAGSGSVVSGRVAYTLGFEGPAVTVDTACSSSLVAMHLAAQALRQGECDLALAGGVTVLASPDVFTVFSRQRGLASDGRCKSFAAAADGTGWAEGVGLVLLERLSDARRNGRRILAVMRGSAVNQDGASNGLTAPNGPSQERVIRQALANARLTPGEIDVVEGHGTGTSLGDPIEAQALLATYGLDRPAERPLWLGSVKSNLGHTQAAAGVAGVIKMVLAMRHGLLPRSLHIDRPSPHVDWDSGAVRLLAEPVPWPDAGRPRRAAVSSFGVSGTNAHLILEQAAEPEPPAPAGDDGAVVPWVVSAPNGSGLRAQANALAEWAPIASVPAVEVGRALVATRAMFDRRAVVVGADRDRLLAGLRALAEGDPDPGLVSPAETAAGGLVFLFSGQGGQRPGMGAELYARFPVFAAAFDEVCELLDPHLDHPLRQVVFTGPPGLLDHTTYAQAGLFALHVALARLLAAFGLKPDVVIGHSIGEVAAAHLAGVFDLPDACRLVAARATLMGRLPAGGGMAAVQARPDELTADLDRHDGQVAIAAWNTPDGTVVSGPAGLVAEVAAAWAARGRKTKTLTVSHAFHSPLMEPILEEFERAIADLTYRPPSLPLIGNLTGETAGAEIATPGYWARHIRETVRFCPAVTHAAPGAGVFLELGPDAVLATAAQHTLEPLGAEPEPLVLSALSGEQPEVAAFCRALARLHTAGRDVTWRTWFADGPALADLPTYAFQREHFWLTGAGAADVSAAGLRRVEHPQLPAAVPLNDGGVLLTGRITATGWPGDHRVLGSVLVPGAALVEWALRAADETGCGEVEELVLRAPLVLPESGGVSVQVVVAAADADGRREVEIYSRVDEADRPAADALWVCHASGSLAPAPGDAPAPWTGAWPPSGAEPLDVGDFYERAAAAGYEYGPAFRGLRAAWRDGADVVAEVALPEAAGEYGGFGIHPALLDAVLHPGLLLGGPDDGQVMLPFAWHGVSLWAGEASTVRVRLTREDDGLRIAVADAAGSSVLSVGSMATRAISADRLSGPAAPGPDERFLLDWTPVAASGEPPAEWAVLGQTGLAGLLESVVPPTIVMYADSGPGADGGLAAVTGALELLQAWLAEPRLADARLAVVTRGGVCADDSEIDPAAAAVWGLVRSAQLENPGRFVLVDLDPRVSGDDLGPALGSGEPQLAVRGGRLLAPRLVAARGLTPPAEGPWRLGLDAPGTVENITAVACPEVLAPLAPGQVRVAVRAAGINFRDVLIALGMYPGGAEFRGSEGSGVVLEVAPDVTSVRVGDRVMGLFEGAFGPVAVADARVVAPMPAGWGWREAASVPVVFLTAWFGLVELGGLGAGDAVLIHSATGGVGMAAVQIARLRGAEVYATASPGKHGVLEEMGIDAAHRASSRDLAFEEVFREATGGRGFDVVLNSLAGEFTDASLRLLAEGGRFVEMGKTDLRALDGISYQAFDLVTDAGPDRCQAMLGRLLELFAEGRLHTGPVRGWPLTRAREALRVLSQARHVGKLVLDVPPAPDPDGAVLITGGTGTLGGLVAGHLVRSGHRRLVLVSRRGMDAPGAAELVARLEESGGQVSVEAVDVTDLEAVRGLVAEHRLTGVVHAAGVLDDGVVTSLSAGRLAAVWAAKATAAHNLHVATADLPLSGFVVFSSTAGVFGSPGQGNYAAANAFCDALAVRRQAAGLPGVSIGWGLWADASGMTGHLAERDLARMTRSGVGALSSDQALRLLDAAQRHGDPHVIAMNLDPRALAAQPPESLPVALRALGREGGRARRTAAAATVRTEDWAGRLAGLPAAERQRVLLDLVRGHVATVLGHADPDAVPPDAFFKDLGFDSLTAVELRNRLSAAVGLRLPAALVFDYPRVGVLADYLLARVAPPDEGPGNAIEALLRDVAHLENALRAAAIDEADRGVVTARLEALLTGWRPESAPGNGGPTVAERLQTVSADQLLDFIDNELGAS